MVTHTCIHLHHDLASWHGYACGKALVNTNAGLNNMVVLGSQLKSRTHFASLVMAWAHTLLTVPVATPGCIRLLAGCISSPRHSNSSSSSMQQSTAKPPQSHLAAAAAAAAAAATCAPPTPSSAAAGLATRQQYTVGWTDAAAARAAVAAMAAAAGVAGCC